MPTNLVLSTSCKKMSGGVTAVAATNQLITDVIAGAFAAGEKIALLLTDSETATQTLVGAGNITGLAPVFVFIDDTKVYLLVGGTVYFSALNSGSTFNDKNGTGNGFVTLSNFAGSAIEVLGIATHQGSLAFIARNTTITMDVDADPDNWKRRQVIKNCGTVCGRSVLEMGELEVFFVMDSGIRSLRARETTLNAFLSDIGSPIDELVVAKLATCSANDIAGIRSINEPTSGRSWFFIKDTIYVLSYFQSAQIIAWTKYLPTYDSGGGVQVAFTPTEFVVLDGQVFARDGDSLYAYGGTGGNNYDSSVVQWDIPFLDVRSPAAGKQFRGIDVAMEGNWKVYLGTNIADETDVKLVYNNGASSFAKGRSLTFRRSTHYKLRGVSSGTGYRRFSKAILHFEPGAEK